MTKKKGVKGGRIVILNVEEYKFILLFKQGKLATTSMTKDQQRNFKDRASWFIFRDKGISNPNKGPADWPNGLQLHIEIFNSAKAKYLAVRRSLFQRKTGMRFWLDSMEPRGYQAILAEPSFIKQ